MMQIKPASDLQDKFNEIEKLVSDGHSVYLSQNGTASMVLMSVASYSNLADGEEAALDLADVAAAASDERLTHGEIFGKLRNLINDGY